MAKPFLWQFIKNNENSASASGGDEKIGTASANEESKNALIEFK